MCRGGFAISPRMILPSSLEWHTQCCFLGCGSSTALVVVQLLSCIRLCDPVDYRCPGAPCPLLSLRRIEHFMSLPALRSLYSEWTSAPRCHAVSRLQFGEGPWARRGRRPGRRQCLGSLLFSQPALLLVLPAGLQELAFTCLNLDTSSMETYMYIHILYFPCLRRAVFCCTNTDDCQQPVGTERHNPQMYHSAAWDWALGPRGLSCDWCSLFLCLFKSELGFPGGANGKELSSQCRRHKRLRFHPWVGKIPWRRERQPTPVFSPGESHE